MASERVISSLLEMGRYLNKDKTESDIMSAITNFKNLKVIFDRCESIDANHDLICLSGTIPVNYRGRLYNIPIAIWLRDSYPNSGPVCYVKPTKDMRIKVSKHVNSSGRIVVPYLNEWTANSYDLLGLIEVMICVFGELPPVFAEKVDNPPKSDNPPKIDRPLIVDKPPKVENPSKVDNPPTSQKSLIDDINSLFESRKFSDVDIVIDNKKYPVHKTILSMRSPVFGKIFEQTLEESEGNEVIIDDIKGDIFEEVLRFIYTDNVVFENIDSGLQLLEASVKYELIAMKNKCEEYLISQLSTDKVCDALVLADLYSTEKLKKTAIKFIKDHSYEVMTNKNWQRVLERQHLLELLKSK